MEVRRVAATDHSVQVPGLPGAVIRAPFQALPGLDCAPFVDAAADERCHAARSRFTIEPDSHVLAGLRDTFSPQLFSERLGHLSQVHPSSVGCAASYAPTKRP